MKLHINGSIVEVPKSVKTISELIAHFDLSSPVIIVEHNNVILQTENTRMLKLMMEIKLSLFNLLVEVDFAGYCKRLKKWRENDVKNRRLRV